MDAPELHYRLPADLKRAVQTDEQHELYLAINEEYRQHLAESATRALSDRLLAASRDAQTLPCRVRTRVNSPDEVFDTYGRFVGDILIQGGGQWINVNTWLAEQGWAFPTFYNSMTAEEIKVLTAATNLAYDGGRGVWQHLADDVGRLDWGPPLPDPEEHEEGCLPARRGRRAGDLPEALPPPGDLGGQPADEDGHRGAHPVPGDPRGSRVPRRRLPPPRQQRQPLLARRLHRARHHHRSPLAGGAGVCGEKVRPDRRHWRAHHELVTGIPKTATVTVFARESR